VRKAFHLDKANGKILGVCAGIANYTGWDVTFVRVGAVLLTVLGGFPWTLLMYGAAGLIAKPQRSRAHGYEGYDGQARLKTSTHEMKESMREIDRRMAEVETFVTSSNGRLAQEIDSLR
jgi:phage shock protein C